VLTLIILAMLTLTVLLSASFIAIESRLAMQNHLATRARMNGVCSLRLALAHLQQEAGPDRRMTARADITADKFQPGWTWQTIRNPLWTGVWRSDRPLQPPAWLVSGRHDQPAGKQSVSLAQASSIYSSDYKYMGVPAYEALILTPWDRSYNPPSASLVTLVGDASASAAENQTQKSGTKFPDKLGKPDGRISLPRVTLPDDDVNGSYAYWVGDEGVKARINLRDPRLDPATATPQSQQAALRGAARSGIEILQGVDATKIPAAGPDPIVNSFPSLQMPAGGLIETNAPSVAKRLFTETTFWSRGVNCDSQNGGLKIDLSNAFELSDDAWEKSEFGLGDTPISSANPITFSLNAYNHYDSSLRPAATPVVFTKAKIKVVCDKNGRLRDTSPVYQFTPYPFGATSVPANSVAVGPTWDALRDYYRLYKELDWGTPVMPKLSARAHFPNTVSLNNFNSIAFPPRPLSSTPEIGGAHYGYFYNRFDTPGAVDFTGIKEFPIRPASLETPETPTRPATPARPFARPLIPAPRPIKVAATPYVARQIVLWGIMKDNDGKACISLTPITVLHNPYNVSVSLNSRLASPSDAGMRISFTNWVEWPIKIDDVATTLGALSGQSGDLINFDILANTTLNPGEFRVFSPPAGYIPVGGTNKKLTYVAGLSPNGGFYVPIKRPDGKEVIDGEGFKVDVMNTGKFFARHLSACWELDDLKDAGTRCSEVTQLRVESLALSGASLSYTVNNRESLPPNGMPPTPIGFYDYGIRWAADSNAIPLFTHTNPMATTCRADANGHAKQTSGYAHTSPSYYFRLSSGGVSNLRGLGGLSVELSRGGVSSAVYTEIPLSAPIALAQLSHANFTIRDQDPLLAIGNSFGSAYIDTRFTTDTNFTPTNLPGIINWDQPLILNAALFDRFYFSGASPEISRGATVSESKSLLRVLEDFAAGTGTLANPRTTLYSNRDPQTVREMVRDYRRIAGATLTEGAFNVNSTSVEAWTAVLASAKRNQMGKLAPGSPSANQNARFPRAVRADAAGGRDFSSSTNTADAWTGLATLNDEQISLLAKSIVDEVRYRTQIVHRFPVQRSHPCLKRTPADYDCRTEKLDVPVPFMGLSQFVNRNLCGWDAQRANCLAGCLQNAITRANTDLGKISCDVAPALTYQVSLLARNTNPAAPPSTIPPWTPRDLSAPETTTNINDVYRGNITLRDPRDTSPTSRAHPLLGAPISLTQADILAAIGPCLATRSDTFVIRCFGGASATGGTSGAEANCWIEAVVQRTPEFCDDSQPPETEVCNPNDYSQPNSRLKGLNHVLGRRFRIVSFRFLNAREL